MAEEYFEGRRNGGEIVETAVVEETGENEMNWRFDERMNEGHPIIGAVEDWRSGSTDEGLIVNQVEK